MIINHILIVSPMYKELQILIEREGLTPTFRYLPEEELAQEDLIWADALVCFNLKSTIDYSQVKWVHSLGAGVDRFLYQKKWNEEVLLTRTICSFGQRIGEYCLSYILRDLQYHMEFQAFKQQKKWEPITPKLLNEQKVMIYGTGEIGQTVAKIFSALGMDVIGVSLSGEAKKYFKEVLSVDSHLPRLSEMNYLINTLPLTEQTANMFNKEIFQLLCSAGFINVGRGASLNEDDLLVAIDEDRVRFAVVDVFSEEPLPTEHPFWNHPKIHITPHISAVTTPDEGVACFIETLKNIQENMPLTNKVDIKRGY
ncbi:D-2-hydroxyacid dehydrogenase [Neobacillus sp. LXY-4]|uniref:D-2-hydroxyacid dehydrogenase n=1 Tax=Neobacillus sp. LXY-4 TaxID=3379826 RepID=UPI003EE3A6D2